ncbi:MAG: cytochrome P450 [Alphaproteobacteria bacterium]|nr:cytochrome P450 [Alphaproteobacteria bacterium]
MADARIDPFGLARRRTGVAEGDYDGETVPLLLRHRELRDAARDWRRFSSDAPARLTLPDETAARSLRQLPIETDPPMHTAYRALVTEFLLRRPVRAAYAEHITELVSRTIDAACASAVCDVVAEFAVPLQSRALAVLLGLPQSEAEEWIGWGAHAFKTEGRIEPERAARLERCIERLIDRAIASPGDDLPSLLLTADFQGRRLTRREVIGFMHVVFAGGRDTVINTICGAIDHLAREPGDLAALRADPALVITAAEEFVRYVSPLTHIGRICAEPTEVGGRTRAAGERVGLCFAAANFDESVFESPQELRLSRTPNPHVGYGSGPHVCLGASHARMLLRTLLRELADRVEALELVEARHGQRDIAGHLRRHGHERLAVRFIARAA